MRYYLKKNIGAIILAIVVLFAPFVYIFVSENIYDDDAMQITQYDVDVTVETDGDILVTEREVVHFNENYMVYYRDIAYGKDLRSGVALTDTTEFDVTDFSVKVYDSDNDPVITGDENSYIPGKLGYSWEGHRDEMGDLITCPSKYGDYCVSIFTRNSSGLYPYSTFEYTYRIKGAVTAYDDVAQLNWIFSPNFGSRTENITVNVHLPSGSGVETDDIYFYGHGTNSGKLESLTPTEIVFTNSRQLPGEETEARIIFPASLVPDVVAKNYESGDHLDDLIALEASTGNQDMLYYILNIVAIALTLIWIAFMIWKIRRIYIRYDKEHSTDFYGEYYRELPASYPPAEMGYLYRFKDVIKEDVSATLMDLIRRKIVTIDYQGQSTTDKHPNYTLVFNRGVDQSELKAYETYLLKWFFEIIAKKDTLSLNELDNYTKTEANATKYYACNQTWIALVKKEASKNDFFDAESEHAVSNNGGIVALGVGLGILSFIGMMALPLRILPFATGIILASVIILISYLATIKRRSVQGNEEFVRWQAFKKFLEEFSNFKDYPMPSIIVWEHYLVYAVSFGIADLVEKQLRFKFKELNMEKEMSYSPVFRYPMFHTYMHMRMMSSFTSATTTINKARAQRVGSGSGMGGRGGFGGGSSFGGGGGGARGR